MKKALLVATMIILGILALFAEKSIIRFENPTKELVVYFNENHFDVASYKPNHYLDVVVTQTEKD
ncbi:MAG: hypothetical protein U9N34_04575, partial [Candidatus Cloacimonadota bacterium]|nr:hypothetical protein [Candidatus Cloacimonadota bacterium]